MHRRTAITVITIACGTALAQNYDIYEVPRSPAGFRPDLSTAPSLAVGLDQVVVLGSHRMTMFDKSLAINPMSPQDVRSWGPVSYLNYPFRPANVVTDPDVNALIFPRADFDPITGHVWMLYAEGADREQEDPPFVPARPETLGVCVPRLHVAASRSPLFSNFNEREPGVIPPVPDPDGFTYWTGFGFADPSGVLGGPSLDLSLAMLLYQENPAHSGVTGSFIYPSIGFETDDVIITGVDPVSCPIRSTEDTTGTQVILFVPRVFTGVAGPSPTTIHDGGRISESEITIAKMTVLDVPDNSFQAVVVHEPYEQWENVTLLLSTDGTKASGVEIQNIRLKGVFKGAQGVPTPGDSDWHIRQSLQLVGSDLLLKDLPIAPLTLDAVSASPLPSSLYPTTPDADFKPAVTDEAFTNAILTRDNLGNPRVFAAHAGIDPSTGLWAVQWYVIDPDLGPEVTPATTPTTYQHFHSPALQSTTWAPTIVAKGRINSDDDNFAGHCYHPVAGVTRTGQLYVEYTFSSSTIDQRIVRARIDNTYTAVADFELVQLGPSAGYGEVDDRWALYGDMQADPDFCRFWSTHTLVEDADEREVWLFKKPYNCFTTDLNMSGSTDPYDMMMYTDYFTAGDQRADTDADGRVDAIDMLNFVDAYDRATSR
jgi:hypothetical protein